MNGGLNLLHPLALPPLLSIATDELRFMRDSPRFNAGNRMHETEAELPNEGERRGGKMSLWIWIMLFAVTAGLAAGLGQPRTHRQQGNGGEGVDSASRRSVDAAGSVPPEAGT